MDLSRHESNESLTTTDSDEWYTYGERGFVYYPGHCTLTATLRRFSSCDSVSTEYDSDKDIFKQLFKATFYANGSRPENEGHVSIIFNMINFNNRLFSESTTFSCVATVIDASGSERFPQSFVVHHDIHSNEQKSFTFASFRDGFGFDRYLKRSTLLSDPAELLPGDCLTLRLEVDFVHTKTFRPIDSEYDTDGFYEERGKSYLRMDTEFFRDLCEMSPVFLRMTESPMAEKVTGRVRIQSEDEISFILIFKILTGANIEVTLSDICDLYALADKYDMQEIAQTCHQLLFSLMREVYTQKKLKYVDKDMHMISELAKRFEDDNLKRSLTEILAIYSDIKNELEGGTGELVACNARKLETEWSCELLKLREPESYFFGFVRRRRNV